MKKGFTCPGYQKKPLEWRYVFKEGEQQDQDQVVFSPPEELLSSNLSEQEHINVTTSQNIQAGHTKELHELWDEANSSLFDQLPQIDPSAGRCSKLEPLPNNIV